MNVQTKETNLPLFPSTEKHPTRSMSASAFTFSSHRIAHEQHPERNEDSTVVDKQRGLVAVLDGVGGANAGEVASQLGARVIRQTWKHILQQQSSTRHPEWLMLYDDLNVQILLQQLIEEAQIAISKEGERRAKILAALAEDISYPGTTVVAAALCRSTTGENYVMGYAHAGDSRIYLLHPDEPIQRLSHDDGYASLKILDHTISPEDAVRIDQVTHADQLNDQERDIFDKRNGITQCLGHFTPQSPSLTIHTAQTVIAPGDRIVLCSDGIHDNLTDAEIEAIIRRAARTTVAHHLVQRAQERSREICLRAKHDDMSAVVITCNQ